VNHEGTKHTKTDTEKSGTSSSGTTPATGRRRRPHGRWRQNRVSSWSTA